jgi:50S ribosomal protein L16 3-hydroxylase
LKSTLLGGLSAAEFLANYWQKKPLLVRGAFPEFHDPLTPNELAGLAMEPDVKARLVFEKGKKPWRLFHGPFAESRLRRLPKSHWSLLVSRVNEYSEDAARILDHFTFIPHWRCEDLMVSFAPPMGTVGEHVDSYDVFLIQGQGKRRWQIQTNPRPEIVPDIDLKILKHFQAEEEWILESGDMLYLPPGVAHYGVALEDCMTYSVGFRAPSYGDLWREFFQLPESLLAELPGDVLFSDPDLKFQDNPGLLSDDAIAKFARILSEPLKHPEVVARWLGSYVTRDTGQDKVPTTGRRMRPEVLEKRLAKSVIWRSDDVRLAYLPPHVERFSFFLSGIEHDLDIRLLPLVQQLCLTREVAGSALLTLLPRGAKLRAGALDFLAELIREGVLTFGGTI